MSSTGGGIVSVDSPSEMLEHGTTLHRSGRNNTWYLDEVAAGACWTWGYDPAYFDGLGCHETTMACTGDSF